MKYYSSHNNNNASDLTGSERQRCFQKSQIVNTCCDELSYPPNHSQTLMITRWIIDELYQINNQEILSKYASYLFWKKKQLNDILNYYQKAATIFHKTPSSNDPNLIYIEQIINQLTRIRWCSF